MIQKYNSFRYLQIENQFFINFNATLTPPFGISQKEHKTKQSNVQKQDIQSQVS
jgi:hypothetical protein